MLYAKPKKEALAIHERAINKYNAVFKRMEESGKELYAKRQDSILLLDEIEDLVNSIANTPKEFDAKISDIQVQLKEFRKTESYAVEALGSSVKSGVGIASGVAGSVAVASLAPTAAMWVATTFGTASTGTAISSLSGAVATKAALAWLGGGALSAGGGGIAAGQALLALASPIGWGIAGISTVASVAAKGHSNKKIANDAIAEAKRITIAGAELNETDAKIRHLADETVMLMDALKSFSAANRYLKDSDYTKLSEAEHYSLGGMVNNALSLAQLLNETV